jgi:hypothetical protein
MIKYSSNTKTILKVDIVLSNFDAYIQALTHLVGITIAVNVLSPYFFVP